MKCWLAGVLLLTLASCAAPGTRPATVLTVMTFNAWGGGTNAGLSIEDTAAAIRAAGADIVGVQETRPESSPCSPESCPPAGESVARRLAAALGYYLHEQTQANVALWANAILSRYPIGAATPNDLGAAIDVGGRRVHAFNIHFGDFPYQPFQLSGIPYGDAPFLSTAADAEAAAHAARGAAVRLLLADLAAARDSDAAFIFGDFNEPSHRDWTARAAQAGMVPLAVNFPSTRAVEAQGFIDVWRAVHPDEIAQPGLTWEAGSHAGAEPVRHDRIDFIFARGPQLTIERARVFGEKSPQADVVLNPWPSDHRAVVATVRF